MGLFGSLGLSFGSSKSKTKSTQTEDTKQNTSGSSLGSSQSATTGQSSTTGSQSTTGTAVDKNKSTSTSNQSTSGVTSNFSAQALQGLEAFLSQTLGNSGAATQGSLEAIKRANAALSGFDPAEFVSGLVADSSAIIDEQNAAALNAFASNVGGTADTNSMAALLAQKAARDKASTLAGVASKGSQDAASIVSNLVSSLVGAASGGVGSVVSDIANVLKGGVSTTQGTATGAQTAQSTNQQTSNQNVNTSQNTTSAEQVSQIVSEIFAQLLDAQSKTTLDSKTKGTTFGATLSG